MYFIGASLASRAAPFGFAFHPNDERAAPRSTSHWENSRIDPLDHIRSYYEALNTGDVERIASHFTDGAIHYYTRLGPHEGARAIAENARWGIDNMDGQWWMEQGIADGDQAVIEWTMTWRDPKSGEKRLNRGTEWFRLEDGRIAEIRAYHHGDSANPRGDLLGFDFGDRGYTTIEDWRAPDGD